MFFLCLAYFIFLSSKKFAKQVNIVMVQRNMHKIMPYSCISNHHQAFEMNINGYY